MEEFPAALDERVGDPITDHHAANRQVAGGEALGDRHQIRANSKVVRSEPLAGAPEAGDHLIGNQQQAVLIDDALDLGPVAGWRDDDATGALHRLADEGRDALRTERENPVFERARGAQTKFLRRELSPLGVPVRLRDVLDARHHRAALRVHRAHTTQARTGQRAAVVSILAADDYCAIGFAAQLPVAAHEAQYGVIGL